jgi:hypothetical protein
MGVVDRAEPVIAEPAAGTRWVAVGRSDDTEARRAGSEAADAALAGRDAKLLIVFCSDSYALEDLLEAINERSGSAPLIGCSTAGEIATGGPGDGGVVVTAIGGEGFSVRTAAAAGASERLREVGADVAACVEDVDETPNRVLMLLTDGVAGNQKEIIRGVHSVVGSGVPLIGGCAGDGLKMERTYQLHGDQVLSDAVVAAAISSDAPIGIGWCHGWERVGEPMLVTKSSNNRVLEIDDRPALEVYVESLQPPEEVLSDRSKFPAWARKHPLGLGRKRSGQEPVRCVGDADWEERSIGCTAEVPQGGLAWFMDGDSDSILRSTETACSDAIGALDGREPIGIMAFDCIGRRRVLGEDGTREEVARITATAPGAPVAGFYSYGEIARTRGVNAVHSQTLVVLAFG